ncbi:MAG TPA: protein kinase, partial [Herpetosiphonaceae bacterium]|nr:protein kinase [Herpetosiphonaceae bacterium]
MGPVRSNVGIKGATARPAGGWLRRILGRGSLPMAAGTAPVPTHERLLKPGDRVGSFRIISEPIGRGSYGHVYLAQHITGPSRGRVALKVAEATNENFLDEEAQLMREITRLGVNVVVRWKPPRGRGNGPALIGHHRLPDGRSLDYLVMEYVGGGNLQHILDTLPEHRLRQRDALAIVSDVAAGLKILHAHGILHHDIKPENILLRQPLHPVGWIKPDPVLIDFGAGFKASDLGKIALGTDGYTAPERYAKVHNLPASDIYSLGQVLRTLLGGPDQVVPAGVHRLIERMTAHDPTTRPSAADVAVECRQLRKLDRSQRPVLRRPLTPRERLVGALSPAMIGLILLGAAARPMVAKDIIVNLASEPRAIVESVIDSVGAVDLAVPTVTPISFWQSATPTEAAPVAAVVAPAPLAPAAPTETPTSTSTAVGIPTGTTARVSTAIAPGRTADVTPATETPTLPGRAPTSVLGGIELPGRDPTDTATATPSSPIGASP